MTTITNDTSLARLLQLCKATAIFPHEVAAEYTILGAMGELGEVCNQAKKILRDDRGLLTPGRAGDIHAECGDVLWYLMLMFDAWGFPPPGNVGDVIPDFPKEKRFEKVDVSRPARNLMSSIMGLPLTWDSTAVLGHFCEMLHSFDRLPRSAPDLPEYAVFSLADVASGVLTKLAARAARGTLGGSGDKR